MEGRGNGRERAKERRRGRGLTTLSTTHVANLVGKIDAKLARKQKRETDRKRILGFSDRGRRNDAPFYIHNQQQQNASTQAKQ